MVATRLYKGHSVGVPTGDCAPGVDNHPLAFASGPSSLQAEGEGLQEYLVAKTFVDESPEPASACFRPRIAIKPPELKGMRWQAD